MRLSTLISILEDIRDNEEEDMEVKIANDKDGESELRTGDIYSVGVETLYLGKEAVVINPY